MEKVSNPPTNDASVEATPSDSLDYNTIITESFDDLDVKANLLRGIYGNGYEVPSIIQQKAIKPVIDGRDVIAQAQSGTGKDLSGPQKVDLASFLRFSLESLASSRFSTPN